MMNFRITVKSILIKLSFIIVSALFVTSHIYAEIIQIPIASQAAVKASIPRPEQGDTKEQVLAEFGEAVIINERNKRNESYGNPPISRWEYKDFVVVFEKDTVIHTVLKHDPKHLSQ